ARLLPMQPPSDLKSDRSRVVHFTTDANSPEIRQSAWAALAVGDGSFDRTWAEASASPVSLADLLSGIPQILDPDTRSEAYDKVTPLLVDFPAALQAAARARTGAAGRYVRVELPRRGTLTLAEVQVFSDGRNIAPQGHAKQSSTANGGQAARATA